MRAALRVLGSRYGVSITLAVVLLVVVGVARLIGGARPGVPVVARPSVAASSSNVAADDDGVATTTSPVPATPGRGAPLPETVADAFLRAWLAHDNVTAGHWLAGLTPYATESLVAKLSGVDPTNVPASRQTGAVTLVTHDSTFVDATAPVDGGVVHLYLVFRDGHWLVDGVDWSRS